VDGEGGGPVGVDGGHRVGARQLEGEGVARAPGPQLDLAQDDGHVGPDDGVVGGGEGLQQHQPGVLEPGQQPQRLARLAQPPGPGGQVGGEPGGVRPPVGGLAHPVGGAQGGGDGGDLVGHVGLGEQRGGGQVDGPEVGGPERGPGPDGLGQGPVDETGGAGLEGVDVTGRSQGPVDGLDLTGVEGRLQPGDPQPVEGAPHHLQVVALCERDHVDGAHGARRYVLVTRHGRRTPGGR
jgi:hypothetical protein